MAATLVVMGSAGVSLLKASEGLRTHAYLDPVGIPTICYGHTGSDVRMGMTLTPDQCNTLLVYDVKQHRAGVDRCVTAPLTPNQRDAVVVFTFNIGISKFCRSTMAKKLNLRDYVGASEEFHKWNKARIGGKLVVLRGLTERRRAERNLFLTEYPRPSTIASSEAVRGILVAPGV